VGEGDAAVLVRQDGHAQAILIALRACITKCSVWQTGAERGTHPGTPDWGTSAALVQASENQTPAPRWNSTSSGVERESHNSKVEP
jgi:hypothetical protein